MSIIKGHGSGEVSTGFYPHLLDQSLKFNDGDAQYLSRTPASAGNRRTWTWSAWIKRSALGEQTLFDSYSDDNNRTFIGFSSGNQFYIFDRTGGATKINTYVSPVLRDVSAWYNLIVAVDTTDGTAGDRVKLYINGSHITSYSAQTNPAQNYDTFINHTVEHSISSNNDSGGREKYFDGYLAEINFIDGTQLTAASFGETVDGIWVPKDTSGLTFGTNGFHLTFKDDVVSEGFNTVAYTGNSETQSISGIGFAPAFVWMKDRSRSTSHGLFDIVRGTGKSLESNTDSAERTQGDSVTAFGSDGFSLGTNDTAGPDINYYDGDAYVGWCWEGGGTPTADNSASAGATPTAGSVKIDGSNLGSALAGAIAATRITANTARGFSVVSWTGSASHATVAHGLGATPKIVIQKRRSATSDWWFYTTAIDGSYDYLKLNTTDAKADYVQTAPTSTTFVSHAWGSSDTMVAYCFAEISGYSKFGSFTGNGGSQAIDVGFPVAWVMLKRTSNASSWGIFDNTRQPANTGLQYISPNGQGAETTNANMVFSGDTFNDNGYVSDDGEVVLYMAFADTREAAFFKDVSSNGNHFTPVNLDYRDSFPDVPTNNYAVMNNLEASSGVSVTLSEGNLKAVGTTASYSGGITSTFEQSSGKWYWEVFVGKEVAAGSNYYNFIGAATGESNLVHKATNSQIPTVASGVNGWTWEGDGTINLSGTGTKAVSSVSAPSAGDVLGFAIDLDNGNVYFYYNGVAQNSGNAVITGVTGLLHNPMVGVYNTSAVIFNFGQDSSFAGSHATANGNADGNGHGSFAYAPPSGYLALCSQNLPDVEIIDGTENFNTVLYTGNGAARNVTGVGFSPDWTWIKRRDGIGRNVLFDSVRGGTIFNFTNETTAEITDADRVNGFVSDGFTLGDNSSTYGATNVNGQTYVAWNWLAGTAFSNDASATSVGTVDSVGQVNTEAGFSVITYTSPNTSNDETVAHGLSKAPELIIAKMRTGTYNWDIHHKDIHPNSFIFTNAAKRNVNAFTTTLPTTSVFGLKDNYTHDASLTYVAYCFHSVDGYSKVGSFIGNANANGPFIFTGFRPAWVVVKRADAAGHWAITDTVRDIDNPTDKGLLPSSTAAEGTGYTVDHVSNGFKLRLSGTAYNASGGTYIYLAFAEQPFKFANAR